MAQSKKIRDTTTLKFLLIAIVGILLAISPWWLQGCGLGRKGKEEVSVMCAGATVEFMACRYLGVGHSFKLSPGECIDIAYFDECKIVTANPEYIVTTMFVGAKK